VPAGMQVNHHCDNPPCWNIEHLYLGTQKQNIADMWTRGREGAQPARAPHGHRGMFERGCRCVVCVGHNRKRQRAMRQNKRAILTVKGTVL